VAFAVFLIVAFSPPGMVYSYYCLRARRRNYHQFKTHMEQYDLEKETARFKREIEADGIGKKQNAAEKSKLVEKELKQRLKRHRRGIKRLHGAGLCRGWLPNPREWIDRIRNWCQCRKGFPGYLANNRQIRILRMMVERNEEKVLTELLEAAQK
jgi:hypothetical protein